MNLNELGDRIIFRGIWGSHAFGTAVATSDEDEIGVYIVPSVEYLKLAEVPQQLSDERHDCNFYSLRRVCELAANANPNLLDSLFLPEDCVKYTTSYWRQLQEKRRIFISKLAANSYCEYAASQIKKAKGCNKRVHNPQPVAPPTEEDFCRFIPKLSDGMPGRPQPLQEAEIRLESCQVAAVESSSELYRLYNYGSAAKGVFRGGMLCCESIPKEDEKLRFIGFLLFNKNAFEQAKSKHRQYWEWKRNRNESRWSSEESGELDFNAKNMMHCIRLLYSGLHILTDGEPLVRFSGVQQQELLDIRNGQWTYEQILTKAEFLMTELSKQKSLSMLPDIPDLGEVDELLIQITRHWEAEHHA